jgi:cytochrome c biogenesis protein CcmG/thiol:disulfide interchange protein DsbE
MMIRRAHVMMILSLVSLLALAACGGGSESADAGRSEASASGAAAGAQIGGQPGQTAPDFELDRVAGGGSLSLSSLRGKVVMVDFWDTWCGPCRVALPHLQALDNDYGDDLIVVGIAMGRYGRDNVRQFIEQNNLTMEMVLFNQDMQLLQNFGGIEGIPTTILIDRDGVVVERWIGGHGKAVYETAVRKALGV